MERKINMLSVVYLVFLCLLLPSGFFSGAIGSALYLLSFLIPFLIGLFYIKRNAEPFVNYLGLKKEMLYHTLALCAPTVALIMLASVITSMFIFAATGQTSDVDVGDSLILALISHALIPAVLEEAIFRYLPMRLLSAHSKKATVLLSAFFFALIHHSLFSIPYAFVAGIVFMSVNLALGSVWPSVIIHFVNNAVSVLIMFGFGAAVYPCLLVLSAISLIIIFIKREEYKRLLAEVFSDGEKVKITAELVIFTVINLSLAILALF